MGTLAKTNDNFFPSLFDDFNTRELFWPFSRNQISGNVPAVNIKETNDFYEIDVAAPGLKKENFKVELDNDLLIISSEKKHVEENSEDDYTRKEFGYESFRRSFSLPHNSVEPDKVKAKYEDGILYITVPKAEHAKAKPAKQILIS